MILNRGVDMDINEINNLCNSMTNQANQLTNTFCHTCGECSNFIPGLYTEDDWCAKNGWPTHAWHKCSCDGRNFRKI